MTRNLEEHAFLSTTLEQRRNHKDIQNCLIACFLSQEEPKKVFQALKDPSWIEAMHEELLQFKLQEVWTLVELPNRKIAIGTKWVFRNKKDERGIMIKTKARLMDVKSAFLYGKIEEEVYREKIDKTLFIRRDKGDILLVQIMYPRFVKVFLDKQVEGMSKHKEIYVTPSHTKKVFANIKRQGKDFSGRDTPLFPTIMVQAQEEVGESSANPTDPHHTPTIIQPSTSQPKKKHPRNKDCSSKEIASLKKKVKQLQKRRRLRTYVLQRLRKVGSARRVKSSNEANLGDQEDASKQGRKIADIDADAEEVKVEKIVSTAEVEVTTASAKITTVDELTLAQTLIEIKAAKPKAVTTVATTTTIVVTRPKARGVIVQEPSEFTTTASPSQSSQLPHAKDKGKEKMVEPKKPLKKKDQIMFDKEVAQKLQA
ncbi:hypothetical protein Tco_0031863 [Tanacetum coccineum]